MHGDLFGPNGTLGFYYYRKYGGLEIVSAKHSNASVLRLPVPMLVGRTPSAAGHVMGFDLC